MVSTRQMSTSLSTTNGGPSPVVVVGDIGNSIYAEDNLNNNNNNINLIVPPPAEPSTSHQTPTIRLLTRSTVLATTSPLIYDNDSIIGRCASISRDGGGLYSNSDAMMIFYENPSDYQEQQEQAQENKFLLELPMEILDTIFSYVGYKKIGQMRVISKQMNQICSSILNSTFSKLQTQMLNRFQTVKAKMPRRESARRNHPLACECDIIETCYMRLSLLQMTFGKHIERKHCCFFPGGILDEVYNVLHYIRTTPKLERPYRVTDELFDLSTMAMEYFKEYIEPNLPEIAYFNKDFFDIPSTKSKQSYSLKTTSEISDSCSSTMPSPPQSNMVLRKGIRKIKQGMKMYNNQLTVLRSELRNCKRKSSEQGKQIAEQQKLLADQQKQTLEYANRLDENDKKNEDMSRKFSTLLQELNKCKTELQYWRSKSPAIQVCNSCGHKITPVVAPEDFQALVNQGIKPEDIIEDVEDCSDTSISNIILDSSEDDSSSNTSTSHQQHPQQQKSQSEFVFPDETTTAKLLAVNSMKNLKRHCSGSPVYGESSSSSAIASVNVPLSDISDSLIGTPVCGTSSVFCAINGGNLDNICSSKNIPSISINPSTFYPSSSSAFNETGQDAASVSQQQQIQQDGIKKRRVQKGGKRKL